jgi:hypothetical protein
MSSNVATREQLIEALLASPLAAEMARSLSADPAAVRRRATELLVSAEDRSRVQIAQLDALAKVLGEERDRLKVKYRQSEIAADTARDELQQAKERIAHERVTCTNIASASADWLKEKGFLTVDDVNRHVTGRH